MIKTHRRKEDLLFISSAAALLILILTTLVWLYSCNRIKTQNLIETSTSANEIIHYAPLLTLIDGTLREVEKNNRYEAVIKTQTATIFKNSSQITCNATECSLFQGSELKGQISSPTAIIEKDKQCITFPSTILGSFEQINFEGSNALLQLSTYTLSSSNQLLITTDNVQHRAGKYRLDLKNYSGVMAGGIRTEFTQLGNQLTR
jgi:hypothetical protein